MVLATLFLTLAAAAPQGGDQSDPRLTSVLSESEQRELNRAAQKWFEAEKKYREETNPDRRIRLNQELSRAREKFDKAWSAKDKKEPIKHMGDLLAIFDGVFTYKRQTGTGEMKLVDIKGSKPFWAVVPRSYHFEQKCPSVLMLPTRAGDNWVEPKQQFEGTWAGTEMAESALFFAPDLEDSLELDPPADTSTEAGAALEHQRAEAILVPAGDAQRVYHIDRDRFLLDCGKGSCLFGLRLASYFPHRFAGLILREPVDPTPLRLGSLRGLKVLLLATDATRQVAEQLAGELNKLEEGACTVLEAKGEYPFPQSGADVSGWAKGARRDLFRSKVTIEPIHDQFNKAYWVSIGTAESVHGAEEDLPRVDVEADRQANRVTINAKNVSSLSLLLNDVLVDLDKEFSVVINGTAITEKRQRSFYDMAEWLNRRFDPSFILTTSFTTSVPEPAPQPADAGDVGQGAGENGGERRPD
jgi:hypothetical protein